MFLWFSQKNVFFSHLNVIFAKSFSFAKSWDLPKHMDDLKPSEAGNRAIGAMFAVCTNFKAIIRLLTFNSTASMLCDEFEFGSFEVGISSCIHLTKSR